MIRFLLHRATRSMERQWDYDCSYMHEIIDASTSAGLRLGLLPAFSQYRGDAPADLWAGAVLASTLDGDCGPCAQLVVDMALSLGVPAHALQAAVNGDFEAAGATGLGFRFARAAISGDPDADALRDEIAAAHGANAVIACAFAAASGRVYPVLKRALGHGAACRRLDFGGQAMDLTQASP